MDLVKFFIEQGADISAANKEGETALSIAKEMEHTEIEVFLKSKI